jgi:hypothetical protein
MTGKRQTGLTMTPIMWSYVEAARETGLFGDSTSTVLRSLIMDAIKKAVADGLIERVKQ